MDTGIEAVSNTHTLVAQLWYNIFCFTSGPIPMMIGAELFRQGPRPRAMSLAGLANWFFTAVIAVSFELIQVHILNFNFILN